MQTETIGVVRGPGDFGYALRSLREDASLTRAELAAKARVSLRWLADAEAGKPTVELAKMLACYRALGYSFAIVPLGKPA
jgi:transcriptional regulator with XRE-family HTH domain